jgi:hypothetical protein
MKVISTQNKKKIVQQHIYMNKTPNYTLVKSDPADETLTWMIQVDDKEVGIAGIETENTEYVESPSVHISLDQDDQSITMPVIKEMIKYAYCNLPSEFLYSRQQVGDAVMDKLNKSLGFEKDGDTYIDDDSLTWQNLKLAL